MEQNVKLWHMLIAALGIVITCATIVYKTGGNDAKQDLRIEFLQKQLTELTVNMAIDRKEDKEWKDRTFNMLTDIQLSLKDKADRK